MSPKLTAATLHSSSVAAPDERVCQNCQRAKHRHAFARTDDAPDGLSAICRVCEIIQQRTSRGPRKPRQHAVADGEQEVAPGVCELCGVSWKQHRRCTSCTIGLGEGHLEGPGVLLEKQPYCGDCAVRKLRARVVEVAV